MSVMLYPCIFCVVLLMDLFVLLQVYEMYSEYFLVWLLNVKDVLSFAFRDLWKEWDDSNCQIFPQNCQFHHSRLESLVKAFNVFFKIYIILSTTVSVLDPKDAILFLQGPFFVHFHLFVASTLCMCAMYLTSFDGFF